MKYNALITVVLVVIGLIAIATAAPQAVSAIDGSTPTAAPAGQPAAPSAISGTTTPTSLATSPAATPAVPVPCIPNPTDASTPTCSDTTTYCDLPSGLCQPKITLGQACSADVNCESGYCGSGVCAASPSSSSNQSIHIVMIIGIVIITVSFIGLLIWACRARQKKRQSHTRNSSVTKKSAGVAPSPSDDSLTLEKKKMTQFSNPSTRYLSSDPKALPTHYRLSLGDVLDSFNVNLSPIPENPSAEESTEESSEESEVPSPTSTLVSPQAAHLSEKRTSTGWSSVDTMSLMNNNVTLRDSSTLGDTLLDDVLISDDSKSEKGSVYVVFPITNKQQAQQQQDDLVKSVKNLNAKQGGNTRERLALRSRHPNNARASVISSASSQTEFTTDIMYGLDNYMDANGLESSQNSAGRYKMASIYSTYSRDYDIFANLPDLPSPKVIGSYPISGSPDSRVGSWNSKSLGVIDENSTEDTCIESVCPRASTYTLNVPFIKKLCEDTTSVPLPATRTSVISNSV
ncbi:4731_t:CDS:2 [Paraglomus brasilianum]|uniref:4731_t:CDS:1 n=1 Tax=Paraglomus brasilianum TaxID=144538 RepID=A0A9N8ZB52_9GLOM|nr:4731_t:CDS:2 [Paraglomus brasilianum]